MDLGLRFRGVERATGGQAALGDGQAVFFGGGQGKGQGEGGQGRGQGDGGQASGGQGKLF
jgi:hypothetical protein